MRIHFVLSLAACLFINLIRAAEAEEWKISPTFDFQVASRFSWPLRPGVNLINIHVIGVHNSSAKLKLTLGPCAVFDFKGNECRQYVNNGTAQFRGPFARGLHVEEQYLFSVSWAPDVTLTNGTDNSPTFIMTSSTNPDLSTLITEVLPEFMKGSRTTRTVHELTNIETIRPSTMHKRLKGIATAVSKYTRKRNQTSQQGSQVNRNANTNGLDKFDGRIIAVAVTGTLLGFAGIAALICWLSRRILQRATQKAVTEALASKFEAGSASDAGSSGTGHPRVEGRFELSGHVWDAANELEASRGGVELSGLGIMKTDMITSSSVMDNLPSTGPSPVRFVPQSVLGESPRSIAGAYEHTISPLISGMPASVNATLSLGSLLRINNSLVTSNSFSSILNGANESSDIYELEGSISTGSFPIDKE